MNGCFTEQFDEVVILKAASSVFIVKFKIISATSFPDTHKFSSDKYVISPYLFQYSVKETDGEKSTIGPIGILP